MADLGLYTTNIIGNIDSNAYKISDLAIGDIDSILTAINREGSLANIIPTDNPALTRAGITTTTGVNINQASGAMIVDTLMQRISTRVQVAAQLVASANNIQKTVSRMLAQG